MPDQPADAAKANPQAPVPVTPDAAPAEEEKPTALAQAVRPFKADSLAQRLRPATTAEMPDTPNLAAPVPTQSGSNNLRDLMSAQAPPPAPTPTPAAAPAPVVSAPAPAAAAPSTERRGGDVQQAVLIKRRDPEYPKIARDSGASGVVELVATIGTDGHVKAVQVVRGHPLLRQPATDAVKAWVYRPTILNGVAVETQTTVLLTFKSPR